MGYGQGQHHQRQGQHDGAAIVHPRAGEPLVGQKEQGRCDDRRLRHVQPENAAPVPDFNNCPAVGRPQHTSRLGRAGHDAQSQPPLFRGHQGGGNGQADGNGAAAADGLYHAGNHNLVQRVKVERLGQKDIQPFPLPRQRHQRGADAEHEQRTLVDAGVAIDIGQPPQQGHCHRIAQQVGGHYPDDRFQLPHLDLQVGHHRRQGRHYHRLIQSGDERAGGDGDDHHPRGEAVPLQSA